MTGRTVANTATATTTTDTAASHAAPQASEEASEDALDRLLAEREDDASRIVDVDQPTQQFVVVRIGAHRFAFPGDQIIKILARMPIWPVPGSPPAVEGVIEVRGEIWAVMRLAHVLGLDAEQPEGEDGGCAILLGRSAALASGLLVDEVLDVLTVECSRVLALPDTLPERLQPIATGLLQPPSHAASAGILVLDLEPLFTGWLAGN